MKTTLDLYELFSEQKRAWEALSPDQCTAYADDCRTKYGHLLATTKKDPGAEGGSGGMLELGVMR